MNTRDQIIAIMNRPGCTLGDNVDAIIELFSATTPDDECVVIPRADLPEVVECEGALRVEGYFFSYRSVRIARLRRTAIRYLALAEYLEAKEAREAEQAAEARITARRDELVDELYQQVISCNPLPAGYSSRSPVVQAAIDRIRELEDKLTEAQEAQT